MVEDDSPPEEASGGTEFRGQRQIAREVEAQNAAALPGVDTFGSRIVACTDRIHSEFVSGIPSFNLLPR